MGEYRKQKRTLTPFEAAALVSFFTALVFYIAIDTGYVRIGRGASDRQPASPQTLTSGSLEEDSRFSKVKSLNDKIEIIETKLREKAESINRLNAEFQDLSRRIGTERKSLNAVSGMILEIESDSQSLKREKGLPTLDDDVALGEALTQVAQMVRDFGIEDAQIGTIKWKNRDYLRLVNAFDFQSEGIYLRPKGMEKVDAFAHIVEDAGLDELTIVYRDTDAGGTVRSRERAFVLRNRLKELVHEEVKVKVSRVNSGFIAADSVEVWMVQK